MSAHGRKYFFRTQYVLSEQGPNKPSVRSKYFIHSVSRGFTAGLRINYAIPTIAIFYGVLREHRVIREHRTPLKATNA